MKVYLASEGYEVLVPRGAGAETTDLDIATDISAQVFGLRMQSVSASLPTLSLIFGLHFPFPFAASCAYYRTFLSIQFVVFCTTFHRFQL